MSTFTASQLDAIKPSDRVQELTIEKMGHGRGCLLMRTLPDGTKSFYFRHFVEKTRKFVFLGSFDPKGLRSWRGVRGDRLTLAAAKEGAQRVAELVAQFGDIETYEAEERMLADKAQREADKAARQGRFGQLFRYLCGPVGATG